MLKAMLVTTATLAARTPAAPLMPQNHGVGVVLIAETSRMPVGNPNPIRKPAGATTRTHKPARTRRAVPSSSTSSPGSQNGKANTYEAVATLQAASMPAPPRSMDSDTLLPKPADRIKLNRTTLKAYTG